MAKYEKLDKNDRIKIKTDNNSGLGEKLEEKQGKVEDLLVESIVNSKRSVTDSSNKRVLVSLENVKDNLLVKVEDLEKID